MFISAQTVCDLCDSHTNGLSSGLTVADFGCAVGAHSVPIAERMSGVGRLYAIDVQKPLLDRLSAEVSARNIQNIMTVWADLEIPNSVRVLESSLDLALLANTLFQIEDKQVALAEVYRLLKSGGVITVIEWGDSFDGIGPQKESVIDLDTAQDLLASVGFAINKIYKNLNHHYAIVGIK